MNPPRAEILRTDRLVLTAWSASDVDDLHALHSDPETMRYVRHGRPESRAECEDLLAAYLVDQATGWAKWRVVDHGGRMVGRAGFGSRRGTRELSYTIRRDRWGEGLATEIAGALVRWHGAHAGAPDRLTASVAVANRASARVLDKLGFVVVGREVLVGEVCDIFALPTGVGGTEPVELFD